MTNLILKEKFGYLKIRNVKPSDAKQFFIKLHHDGRGYGTICSVRSVLKPAFKLTDVALNDSKTRQALAEEMKKLYLAYIAGDKHYCQYYNEIVILLGTGLRVSELYGLTKAYIEFDKMRIIAERQLTR